VSAYAVSTYDADVCSKMKQHIDVTHMEFLPYHYLLATVGNAGHLKYQDTSTGQLVASHPTRLGPPASLAQNPHNAILHMGHQSGTVTLWSPNLSTPHVKLQAHLGPVRALSVDPSAESCGRYMATAGLDGKVKIWDARMWGETVNEWHSRVDVRSLDWSQRGMLAVGGKSNVTIYNGLQTSSSHSPTPYLSHQLPSLVASRVRFTPYEDQLTIGHARGISTILVPGAGEAQFDSTEADVYESYSRRRERDVRAVLEKIRPELITLDEDFLGRVRPEQMGVTTHAEREARPFRKLGRLERLKLEGKADGDEDEAGGIAGSDDEEAAEGPNVKERHKMRFVDSSARSH
jgi:U3 small nucleolar RNA-associated protein 7